MQRNRTMPDDVLVPVLAYPSVTEAVAWLTRAFGFTLRWQIEEHRAQLGVGESRDRDHPGLPAHRWQRPCDDPRERR
jgi:hypothetical protein